MIDKTIASFTGQHLCRVGMGSCSQSPLSSVE